MNYLEYNFENLSILPAERRDLRRVRRSGSVLPASIHNFYLLCHADLLDNDLSDERDSLNAPIKLDTVHLTDKGVRYLEWRKSVVLNNILLPLVISVGSNALIIALQLLLRWLL